jgi:hypothetical protein
MTEQSLVGQGLFIIEVSRSHSDKRRSVELPGRVTSPKERHVPDNTQHSQQTDVHAIGGIRTRNHSKQAAADPRLNRRGHFLKLYIHYHTHIQQF